MCQRVVIGDGPLLDSEWFDALLALTEFTELTPYRDRLLEDVPGAETIRRLCASFRALVEV